MGLRVVVGPTFSQWRRLSNLALWMNPLATFGQLEEQFGPLDESTGYIWPAGG